MSDVFSPLHLREAARLLDGERVGEDAAFSTVSIDSRTVPPGALVRRR
jgi:UDP-N-acetylmuramyl pentapeptide synthase